MIILLYYADMDVIRSGLREGSVSALDDTHNDAKETEGTSEDFHNQYLHERVRVLSISDCAS